jgi:hypothetical protein
MLFLPVFKSMLCGIGIYGLFHNRKGDSDYLGRDGPVIRQGEEK